MSDSRTLFMCNCHTTFFECLKVSFGSLEYLQESFECNRTLLNVKRALFSNKLPVYVSCSLSLTLPFSRSLSLERAHVLSLFLSLPFALALSIFLPPSVPLSLSSMSPHPHTPFSPLPYTPPMMTHGQPMMGQAVQWTNHPNGIL